MEYPRCRVWVFAKPPVPGAVKTRLQPALDVAGAAALHRELVVRTLQRLTAHPPCPISLACAPDARAPFFSELAERFQLALRPQTGADLGARMADIAAWSLACGEWPILVGTDCPEMSSAFVARACQALSDGNQAVLGPAEDGGYVLLGLRQSAPELFTGIPWGTGSVLAQTRAVLKARQWPWAELATLWDVDRPADLARYAELLAAEATGIDTGSRNPGRC